MGHRCRFCRSAAVRNLLFYEGCKWTWGNSLYFHTVPPAALRLGVLIDSNFHSESEENMIPVPGDNFKDMIDRVCRIKRLLLSDFLHHLLCSRCVCFPCGNSDPFCSQIKLQCPGNQSRRREGICKPLLFFLLNLICFHSWKLIFFQFAALLVPCLIPVIWPMPFPHSAEHCQPDTLFFYTSPNRKGKYYWGLNKVRKSNGPPWQTRKLRLTILVAVSTE